MHVKETCFYFLTNLSYLWSNRFVTAMGESNLDIKHYFCIKRMINSNLVLYNVIVYDIAKL